MNFNINLATRVYVDFRKLNIFFALIGVALFFWLFFAIYTCVGNAANIRKLGDYKSKLSHGADSKKVSESDYAAFLANVKNVNSILYNRSFDWLTLLANLERLVPDGVALRGVVPSERGAVLKLSGSSRNFAAIRRFIENLESSKTFIEVYLTDHAAVQEESQKVIIFTVTCKASAS